MDGDGHVHRKAGQVICMGYTGYVDVLNQQLERKLEEGIAR
jgi:hypothetical protein